MNIVSFQFKGTSEFFCRRGTLRHRPRNYVSWYFERRLLCFRCRWISFIKSMIGEKTLIWCHEMAVVLYLSYNCIVE